MSAPNHQIPLQNNGTGMQNQPQMGAANQQNQNIMPPFVSNMQPPMNTHQFMNAANHHLPLQNNQMHMPNIGMGVPPQSQSHAGFGPQNAVSNAGYNPMFQGQGQVMHNAAQINLSQHILAQTIMSMLQQPNMNIASGQFSSQFPVQNRNQQLPMQVPNPSQVGLHGMHPGSGPMFGFQGQVPQAMISQNPMFSATPHMGMVPGNQVRPQFDRNEKSVVPPNVNTNAFMSSSFSSPQLQGNSSASHSQANPNSNPKSNVRNPNWKGSPSKNFKNKQTRGGFQGGFQKSKFPKELKGKGPNNVRVEPQQKPKFGLNPKEQQQEPKRSFFVTYTDQEIQQWREARRKNHPFNNNIQKKQSEHTKSPKVDRVVLQRELKQVLAKQAELGVEVAEIPSYYLKDRENQGPQSEGNKTSTNKRKFQNKFNKKPDRKGRFSKKQKFADRDSSEQVPSMTKKKATLLQKLLSADIKKDRSHLLQAFRFMVTNFFFRYYPDKPLIYPSVVVKETGSEGDAAHAGKHVVDHDHKKTVHKTVNDNIDGVHSCVKEENDDDDDHENLQRVGIEKCDEEEGEIID